MKFWKTLANIGLSILALPFAIIGGAIVGIIYALIYLIRIPIIVITSIWTGEKEWTK